VPKEFNTIKKGISLCSIFAATSGQLSPPPLLSIYNINPAPFGATTGE
jgi:hypothetical protein